MRESNANSYARVWQILLLLSAALSAWLGMQAVHELGHVVGAWLTGGTVERVVLHPLAISRTDVAPNPEPLVVVWAGPIVGILLPLAAWGIVAYAARQGAWAVRFFAGFCLLANGLYIGIGSFEGVGDAGDMLRAGSPIWTLWLFGLIAAPAGLALWNGL
ncbi:MAG: M50 family metallopeptidase, partial [Pirellulaceae bacterium]|nr:M50 family metallopeptidase [Pirellulaceae bacterium]